MLNPEIAYSCRCALPDKEELSDPNSSLCLDQLVVLGTVVSKRTLWIGSILLPERLVYEVDVLSSTQDELPKTITVSTGRQGTACGLVGLEAGQQSYILLNGPLKQTEANGEIEGPIYSTGICNNFWICPSTVEFLVGKGEQQSK